MWQKLSLLQNNTSNLSLLSNLIELNRLQCIFRSCNEEKQRLPVRCEAGSRTTICLAGENRWMDMFFQMGVSEDWSLGLWERQEQCRLEKIPRCAIGFLCTELLRAAPLGLYPPLLLLSMDTGKHSAREQRVSCRDGSCHCCSCRGRAPLNLPSVCPQGLLRYRWVSHQGILYYILTEESA